mmetsp:Transcript_30220/g.30690  ORF Transcript_30220/g.30690 Transcript_30220/m.30690 type:complete len:446 (+) Transcript_30220:290-1627(+)
MVASSSNLLLVASSHAGHVRTGSTIPNDHDLTMTNFSNENRRGYMIRSTSTNNISGSSGNLKDMIMLETVAPIAFAAIVATAAPAPASSITPTIKKSSTVGGEKQRPRPRRKKMVSIGVDTMNKMMLMTSSNNSTAVVVAMPESPTVMVSSRKHERACEQRDDDDMEAGIFNLRSTSNRTVLDFDMATPAMSDMLSMPAPAAPAMNQNSKQQNERSTMIPALPTPAMNRSSKLQNERSNNDNAPPPMKKQMKKKQLQMGRRLRQLKKRLSASSKAVSQSSSKEEEEEEGNSLLQGTSTTSSTSSLGQTSSQEEDTPLIIDMMSMMTTLKPRVRSLFEEGYEEDMRMMPLMPSMPLPAAPWSPSTCDGGAIADDTADDWGVFASIQDNDDDDDREEEEHESSPKYINFNYKSKSSSRLSFTKITTNPCFQPHHAHLPVSAATAGSE